ncbi:hypothetical protein [Rhizobium ruizarguesonis]|uniref:hypothetical protein n=1 Tax=Rhizobium ruizarguesonis TaxID=2081791 RepID=UPI0013BEEE7A|nr:hypothetical protein [Rhizobium ruizarguesonis]NEH32637.1 hypothetical protein [Rhizobium ruizarguesonis]NEK07457.1 hypothetical protein [Rhizobium ruizarguesonis]
MDAERVFELACEMRFTAPCKPTRTYYIDPNQFKGDEAFAEGVDTKLDDESTARCIAFRLARLSGQNVSIDVRCEGEDDDIIVVKPTVKVA